MSRPSEYQAIAKISRHGKLLPLYSSWLRLPFAAIKTDLLKDSPKTLEWTAASEEAFQGAECFLTKAVPLQHPSAQAKLSLATDTSDSHIGGIMQQKSDDHWLPLGFFQSYLTRNLVIPRLTGSC